MVPPLVFPLCSRAGDSRARRHLFDGVHGTMSGMNLTQGHEIIVTRHLLSIVTVRDTTPRQEG